MTFSPQRLGIFCPNFTRLLYVPIYARLQFCIQLAATLTKVCHIISTTQFTSYAQLKMSTIGRNARVHSFDSFVDRCLWQVIPDLLQCILALGWFLALTEVCEMLEASHVSDPTHGSRVDSGLMSLVAIGPLL